MPAGSFRTRVLSYSGYGPTDFPLIEVPEAFARQHPEMKKLRWDEIDGTRVLLAPYSRTMAINGEFDLAANPEPPAPQKFGHHDPHHPRVLVDTCEEWVLYNCSIPLWSHTNKEKFKQPGQYGLHYQAYPISKAEGQARFARDPEFQITTKGADHPFHMHVNPFWVTRIEVPDEQGRLHNVLDEPAWMDTVSIPRGGRVRVPVALRGLHRHVGEPLPHPDARGSRDDAGGRGPVAGRATRTTSPRTRVASHAMSGGRRQRDLSGAVARPDVPAEPLVR